MKNEKLKLKAKLLENNINYIFDKIFNICNCHPLDDRKNMDNNLKQIRFLVKEALKQIDDFEDKHGTKAMPERIKTYE